MYNILPNIFKICYIHVSREYKDEDEMNSNFTEEKSRAWALASTQHAPTSPLPCVFP